MARPHLTLDLDTIVAINEELKRRLDIDPDEPLEKLHGSLSLTIVKGQFQLIEVAGSRLLQQRGQRDIRRTA